MPEYDILFDQLQSQEPVIASAAGTSEATTRLRAIDVVLFDVLGWDRTEVEAEKYCRTEGYAGLFKIWCCGYLVSPQFYVLGTGPKSSRRRDWRLRSRYSSRH